MTSKVKDVYSSLSDASKVRELLKDVYSSLSLASKVRELLKDVYSSLSLASKGNCKRIKGCL